VEKTSRLGSRDPVASGVRCGPHGGKSAKMKSWTISWLSLKTKVSRNFVGAESRVVISGGYMMRTPRVHLHQQPLLLL
jgi:hypothetical protein